MYSEADVEALVAPYREQVKLLNQKLEYYEAKIRSLECQLRLEKCDKQNSST